MEWDYGRYEGRTTADIRVERPGWSLWSDGVPGGETAENVGERADRIVDELRKAGGPVAVSPTGTFSGSWPPGGSGCPPRRGGF